MTKLEQQDQQIEALKIALRDTVREKEQYKQNYLMLKHIGKTQMRYIRSLEEELICYKAIVSG